LGHAPARTLNDRETLTYGRLTPVSQDDQPTEASDDPKRGVQLDFWFGVIVVFVFGVIAMVVARKDSPGDVAVAVLGVMGTIIGHHMGFRHASSQKK
jgi:hypothetical protein